MLREKTTKISKKQAQKSLFLTQMRLTLFLVCCIINQYIFLFNERNTYETFFY